MDIRQAPPRTSSAGPLFEQPPHNGVTTSKAAAASIASDAKTLRARVFTFILSTGRHGATDEEIQHALQMNPNTQRPRRGELYQQGHIVRSGLTRPSSSGRQCDVWMATRQGASS